MDNSVMLDYLAVTIKGLAPDDVIEKILILPCLLYTSRCV